MAAPNLVLLAFDESDHSVAALTWTFETILKEGDKLTVVAVVGSEADKESTISRTKTLLRAIWQTTNINVVLSIRVLVGNKPGALICALVEELNPSLLILGSAGKTQAKGLLVGSVSNYCVANAKTSVIVARLSEEYERGRTGGSTSQERRRSKSPLVDVLNSANLLKL
ncbi:hypothetical protein HK098_007929 [Nowakowskiella sp. JEL0407]|nr:hypothetical protein HK098_007929 [Nowakowskiella sp. JEL0407]